MTERVTPTAPQEMTGAGLPDATGQYLHAIGKIPLLNAAQEVELAQMIEAGLVAERILVGRGALALELGDPKLANREETYRHELTTSEKTADITDDELWTLREQGTDAKDTFVESNLRLVVSIAKRYPEGNHMQLIDDVQEGTLGLIRAVEKFDYAKGFKFSTYATNWIRQAISRGRADQDRDIRLPVHIGEAVSAMDRHCKQVRTRYNREATVDELAELMDEEPKRIIELMRWRRHALRLEMRVGDDGDIELGDLLEDVSEMPVADRAADAADAKSDREWVQQQLAAMDSRMATIVRLYYGIGTGEEPKTISEIQRMGYRNAANILARGNRMLTAATYRTDRFRQTSY